MYFKLSKLIQQPLELYKSDCLVAGDGNTATVCHSWRHASCRSWLYAHDRWVRFDYDARYDAVDERSSFRAWDVGQHSRVKVFANDGQVSKLSTTKHQFQFNVNINLNISIWIYQFWNREVERAEELDPAALVGSFKRYKWTFHLFL